MSDIFLSKYFPPSKTFVIRAQIINFRQRGGESLSETCDRYQELLRLCPHHGLEKWFILQILYEGFEQFSKLTIDAAAGGNLMNMSARDFNWVGFVNWVGSSTHRPLIYPQI
jgi:Retrotransposon gag protein